MCRHHEDNRFTWNLNVHYHVTPCLGSIIIAYISGHQNLQEKHNVSGHQHIRITRGIRMSINSTFYI
jgi:hypothetical protein